MELIQKILSIAQSRKAADVHIVAGAPVMMRVGDELTPVSKEELTRAQAKELSYALLTDDQIVEFEEKLDLDFMYADDSRCRYRVNISYNDGAVGAVIRLLAAEPYRLDDLKMPPVVSRLAYLQKGLLLITGSTSQGKTTTMAAMIDAINTHHRRAIVTIEDPIEYVHVNKQSIVRQREVGKDTRTFASGLRAALRQDPDVIAIGEMRDYETIKIALTAAETGVFVLSTLHIISIDKIIERLLSYAPEGGDGHIRDLLANALMGVIHQELLPTVDGGKRVATEILIVSDAARNVIRNRSTFHLRNVITTGARYGMQTMKQSLDVLLDEGAISRDSYESVLASYR